MKNTPSALSPLAGMALLPVVGLVLCLRWLANGAHELHLELPWVPSLGLTFGVYVDGLSVLFLLLIFGVGALVFLYAAAYLASAPYRRRVFALLVAFMLAMVGAVTADTLISLFVFWELTSFTSFLLVGTKHADPDARRAAQQAFIVTAGGGLVLLVGFILLASMAGSYSLREITARAPTLVHEPLLPAALGCIFVGAFSKSAQWPFHFWLPNAMAAPTPVSAYLHSATMVKLGVYLLARLEPAFGDLPLWRVTLVTVGAATALWAMVLAVGERDLKRILAWSTVSALGTLVLLIGLPGAGAAAGTAAFLVAHALYKAPLFFVAGNVDHSTGTRSIDDLAGMGTRMPWTAAVALLAGLSMAGVPLSFGYVAKDLMGIAKVEGELVTWAAHVTLLVSALTVAVAGVAAIRVFWHRGGATLPSEVHEAPPLMIAAPLVAAGCGAVFGLAPWVIDPVISAASAAMGDPAQMHLLRAGPVPGPEKYVTALVLGSGIAMFVLWETLHRILEVRRVLDRFGPAAWYEAGLAAIPRAARAVVLRVQTGRLTTYVWLSFAFTTTALAAALTQMPAPAWAAPSVPSLPIAGATAAIVAAAVAACVVRDAFVMLLATGLSGVGAAVLFLFLGAPDLALTQLAVEVAFVVMIAAVLLRIRRLDLRPVAAERRLLRLALGLGAGGLVGSLLLSVTAVPFDPAMSRYFASQSVGAAHGRNVVNVIIVDFRALDTLGEVSVVAMALLAALPVVRTLVGPRMSKGGRR